MNENWQITIRRQPRPQKQRPMYVSLNKRGEIAMNERAFQAIGQPASVTLMYDKANHAIGVKYPVPIDRHFFMVRSYGRGRRMRIVRAARMLKQFGIKVEQTIVFSDIRVETYRQMPMLVLEMKNNLLVAEART